MLNLNTRMRMQAHLDIRPPRRNSARLRLLALC
jgi:hypothetical protein